MFTSASTLVAFDGAKRIASGQPLDVARQCAAWLAEHPLAQLLVFDAETGRPVELDLRGSLAEVEQRLAAQLQTINTPEPPPPLKIPRAGKGRPKLGVIAREVTLLPRHWDWLSNQPGGASVTLRKLVEQAARQNADQDALRTKRNAAYRFMHAMAGNEAGFEEALRALFAGDYQKLDKSMDDWPVDVREHISCMLQQ